MLKKCIIFFFLLEGSARQLVNPSISGLWWKNFRLAHLNYLGLSRPRFAIPMYTHICNICC